MNRDEDDVISGGDGDYGDDGCCSRFRRMMKCRRCGGENSYTTVVEVGKIGVEPCRNLVGGGGCIWRYLEADLPVGS